MRAGHLRGPVVRVRRGEVFIEAETFDPLPWKYVRDRVRAPVNGLMLTEPLRGPKGGFKYAELRGKEGVVWQFYPGQEWFYKKVAGVLRSARK
jgi:hypothetical protein